ncbi:MAG: 4-(cytidine 5'-diphospho)-2-C-methyl-D-erythritol kinase [Bacteroidota bacterium]|nr:4-(cytidine 5'-diphospho)-2-C-methyl-D-erythritol kinase [Bacteroidota bacterium]
MIVFPNCKINLGLHILNKRRDGFHDLETIFYPLPFKEALEIIPEEDDTKEVSFTATGRSINLAPPDNICVKAYQLLKKDFQELPSVKIHLHKTIPAGAGLGGGSADGAFTLLLLNKKFDLQLEEKALEEYALALGSDCAFFIKNKPCIAFGRGEVLESIEIDLRAYKIIVVNPGIHINTAWAFEHVIPRSNRISLKEITKEPLVKWKEALINDFEMPIFKYYPEIEKIKTSLYEHGAIYASMTGSGSTVYGLFPKDNSPVFKFPADYFIKIID